MALSRLQMKSSKALGLYLFAQTNSLISFSFSLLSLSLIITWSLLDGNAKVGAGTGVSVGVGVGVGVGLGLGMDSGTLSLNGFSLSTNKAFSLIFFASFISLNKDPFGCLAEIDVDEEETVAA